jgi:hypothetical protein
MPIIRAIEKEPFQITASAMVRRCDRFGILCVAKKRFAIESPAAADAPDSLLPAKSGTIED